MNHVQEDFSIETSVIARVPSLGVAKWLAAQGSTVQAKFFEEFAKELIHVCGGEFSANSQMGYIKRAIEPDILKFLAGGLE